MTPQEQEAEEFEFRARAEAEQAQREGERAKPKNIFQSIGEAGKQLAGSVLGNLLRVPGAIRGYTEAVQKGDAYNAPERAWQGFKDPESVQSAEKMAQNFGADTTAYPIYSVPPPDAKIMARNMNNIPGVAPKTEPETTLTTHAKEYGTAFDNLAPTGLEIIPPALALAWKAGRTGAKIGAEGAAATVDAIRGGNAAQTALEGAGEGIRAYKVRQATKIGEVLNPTLAPDADRYRRIGESLGFTPDQTAHPAIEYGELSAPARRNKVLAQGEGGDPLLQRHNAITAKIQRGFDDAVQAIGGYPMEPVQAGDMIRQGVRSGAKRIAESVTASHNDIIDQFPGLLVKGTEADNLASKLNAVEKFAKGRSVRGVVPEQRAAAGSLLSSVDAIRNSKFSYKQLNEAREMIGDVAFDDVGDIGKLPAYQKHMRDLYFSLDDALVGTVGKMDRVKAGQFRPAGQSFEPLKEKLIESNKILHEMFLDQNAIGQALGNSQKASERVFNEALLHGDTRKIQALRNLLTPEEFQQAKAAYINALVKKGKEDFTYKSAKNTMANNRSVITELFSDTPDHLERIKDIVDLGDRVGAPLLPGSSGQWDFGGANTISKLLHKVTEPFGDVTAEIGQARARAGRPGSWDRLKEIPIYKAAYGLRAGQNESPALPPYLQRPQ